MTAPVNFLDFGNEHFVALTTFKRSGEGVATTVWIARDGDDLIVTTPDGTGKVKRVKNIQRVEIRPSNRFGKVKENAPMIVGSAEVVREPGTEEFLHEVFGGKYKTEYKIFMAIEKRGKDGNKPRVMIRIHPAVGSAA
jgi:PPOX class probable F420-dependent enzyme